LTARGDALFEWCDALLCTDRPVRSLAGLVLPRLADARLVPAVDVSPWLRPDAACSPDRLFCHTYGRAKGQAQMIPGWPYSFVAALEPGRTSWTQILDVVRLGPADDATAVTAGQLRGVVNRLIDAGQWTAGDPDIVIVCDAGYDDTRLAHVLSDLPVQLGGTHPLGPGTAVAHSGVHGAQHRAATQTRSSLRPGRCGHMA
jgi:hypothetical protein